MKNEVTKYYKCVGDNWANFKKGHVYHMDVIGQKYLMDYPNDFKPVLPYPTVKELIVVIDSGKGKTKVLKALKQWSKCK